jgi:protein-S-isoprenylcysteine O-methyltransferase Ste14
MDRGTLLRVWLPLLVGLYALTVVFRSGPGPHDGIRWLGLADALIGLGGVILARYTLGRSFSVTAQARDLVTTGIYSRIRNPIYVSSAMMIAGLFLILRIPWLWLMLPMLVLIQTFRARKEARVLEDKFGDAYRQYRAGTWF